MIWILAAVFVAMLFAYALLKASNDDAEDKE